MRARSELTASLVWDTFHKQKKRVIPKDTGTCILHSVFRRKTDPIVGIHSNDTIR